MEEKGGSILLIFVYLLKYGMAFMIHSTLLHTSNIYRPLMFMYLLEGGVRYYREGQPHDHQK